MIESNKEKRKRAARLCSYAEAERWFARAVADHLKSDNPHRWEHAGIMLAGSSPNGLWLVAEALEGKANPTPTCLNIITAWDAAYEIVASENGDWDVAALPTLREVKTQYTKLFGLREDAKGFPKPQTFRKVLRRYGFPLRKDKVGRPKNSHQK